MTWEYYGRFAPFFERGFPFPKHLKSSLLWEEKYFFFKSIKYIAYDIFKWNAIYTPKQVKDMQQYIGYNSSSNFRLAEKKPWTYIKVLLKIWRGSRNWFLNQYPKLPQNAICIYISVIDKQRIFLAEKFRFLWNIDPLFINEKFHIKFFDRD